MKWFSRLFCKHEYGEERSQMIDAGLSKMFIKECQKCGREKVRFL